jgi:hypothetical protein
MMSNRFNLKKCFLLLALLALPLFYGATVLAASNNTDEKIYKSTPISSSLAAMAIDKVIHARIAIKKDKKPAKAINLLKGVGVDLDLIWAGQPKAEEAALLDYIKSLLSFEDNDQVLADLLPLYNATSTTTSASRVSTIHSRLDRIKKALESSDRITVNKELDDMTQAVYADAIDIPFNAAKKDLDVALDTLSKENMPDDETLFSLQKNLITLLGMLHSERS